MLEKQLLEVQTTDPIVQALKEQLSELINKEEVWVQSSTQH